MKGQFTSHIGTLEYMDSNGILLKGKNLRFDGQPYKLLARIEDGSEPSTFMGIDVPCKIAKIIQLVPTNPAKFKTQTATSFLLQELPKVWEAYIQKHPSILLQHSRLKKEKKNKLKLQTCKQLLSKIEALVEQLKAEINES